MKNNPDFRLLLNSPARPDVPAPHRINPSLTNMKEFLAAIGRPEKRLTNSVIIGGTNGKASTAYALYYMLRAMGYTVGLYTSPHIIDFRERIIINERKIPATIIAAYLAQFSKIPAFLRLTYFEKLTALAFSYFTRQRCDWTILEIGMGGRWDAVRCAAADSVILVNASIDHVNYLGNHRAEILKDKLFITERRDEAIMGFTTDRAEVKSRTCYCYGEEFYFSRNHRLVWLNHRLPITYPAGLLPVYRRNLAAALCWLCNRFPVASVIKAYRRCRFRFPARFDITRNNIVFDSAHNPGAFFHLVRGLLDRFSGTVHLLLGVCADKEIDVILPMLRHRRIRVIAYEPDAGPRSLPKKDLIKLLDKHRIYYYHTLNKETLKKIRRQDCLCVTGSLMTISRFSGEFGIKPTMFWT